MGLLAIDPYLQGIVGTLAPTMMQAMNNAATRLGSSQSDAAALRWFGASDKASKSRLAADLRRMRAVINVNTISVGSEDLATRDVDVNASAYRAGGKVKLGDAVIIGGGNAAAYQHDARSVFLDAAFKKLPRFLPIVGAGTARKIDASGWKQSQLNTLIHELSHLLLGTEDVVGASGESYGTQRAEALAKANPSGAQNNAENWGIFVEAIGHHGIS
jgi:hypothetical protein